MERFAEMVNGYKPLTFFVKCSISDMPHGSEYASELIQFSSPSSPEVSINSSGAGPNPLELFDRTETLYCCLTPGFGIKNSVTLPATPSETGLPLGSF